MSIKPKDNFSLLPLFCFTFARQSQENKTMLFFPNIYRSTSLYGPQLNVAAFSLQHTHFCILQAVITNFTKLNIAKKSESFVMTYGPYDVS
jgi:hypothetical protein